MKYLGASPSKLACRYLRLLGNLLQVEGAFGVTKEDGQFRRFYTRGKAGVSCELFLVCFGYNVNKLHHKIQQGRCGTSLHPLKQKAS
jgi:hypothetical protein